MYKEVALPSMRVYRFASPDGNSVKNTYYLNIRQQMVAFDKYIHLDHDKLFFLLVGPFANRTGSVLGLMIHRQSRCHYIFSYYFMAL